MGIQNKSYIVAFRSGKVQRGLFMEPEFEKIVSVYTDSKEKAICIAREYAHIDDTDIEVSVV
jgi:hypothetical protein